MSRDAAERMIACDLSFKIVKMIMEKNMDPTIVFAFSKKECESLAMQVGKLDFNDDAEKDLVEQVYTNAIDSLSDDDKLLPQIEHMLPVTTTRNRHLNLISRTPPTDCLCVFPSPAVETWRWNAPLRIAANPEGGG